MASKITIGINPESARLEYDRGIELEFTADQSDVLDHFDANEIVAHFDLSDLLEAAGEDAVRDWLD